MDQAPGSPQGPQGAAEPARLLPAPGPRDRHPLHPLRAPICPECMVSASVGFQCPDCVRGGSGTGHAPGAAQPRTIAGGTIAADPRLITKILVGINLAVFLAVQLAVRRSLHRTASTCSAWPCAEPSRASRASPRGEWYRLVTAMFLHQQLSRTSPSTCSACGGSAARWRRRSAAPATSRSTWCPASPAAPSRICSPRRDQPSLGASGAIFGLFGATAVLMRRLNYDMRPVIALLVINLIFTFRGRNIAWQAHIGGLVAGVVIGYAMVHAPRERRALVQYGDLRAGAGRGRGHDAGEDRASSPEPSRWRPRPARAGPA